MKTWFHKLWFLLLHEKLAVSLIAGLLKTVSFSLPYFNNLPLHFIFNSFIVICQGVAVLPSAGVTGPDMIGFSLALG